MDKSESYDMIGYPAVGHSIPHGKSEPTPTEPESFTSIHTFTTPESRLHPAKSTRSLYVGIVGTMQSSREKPMRRTCHECRMRKVRCDGQRRVCGNCQRLGFDCSFRDGDTRDSPTGPRRLRRCRVRQACIVCHELKVRCSGNTPACHRCREKGTDCVYPTLFPRRRSNPAPTSGTQVVEHRDERLPPYIPENLDGESDHGMRPPHLLRQAATADNNLSQLLTTERVKHALDVYFEHIHILPACSFLHRASLLKWYNTGQADNSLLLSIVAITSCLPGIDRRETNYGTQCAQLAQRLIVSDLGRPTILKAQALLLMIRYHMWTGIFTEALMLMGTLTRFAFALRLNYENPNICSLAQESRRRLMWGIYILDTMLAGGLPEFTLCPSDVMHIRLPSQESNFELDIPGPNVLLDGAINRSTDLGLLAYYIRVMSLRDSILRYTKQAASSTQDTAIISNRIGELDSSLQEFALHLPDSISFSEKNFHLRAFSKTFPRYIMIHIWWHQCHCDLYRCFLANLRESLPQRTLDQLPSQFVLGCQAKGFQHAHAIADICSLVTGIGSGAVVLDMETAECAYQAGRILIHATPTPTQALVAPFSLVIQQVNSCILFIKSLAAVFPTVSAIAHDLSTLVQRGNSLSISDEELPEHCAHVRPAIGSMANRSQIISKHSMLNRSQLTDDSALEDMPFVGGKPGRTEPISTSHNSVVDGSHTSPTSRSQTSPRRSGFIPVPQESDDALIPTNTAFGDPNLQEGAWWNQTNAFEGAWDVAVFHPMSQYQDMWPPLELFTAPSDLPYSGV